MRIRNSATGQEAYRVQDQDTGLEQFDCYPIDRPSNEKKYAVSFDQIRDAALYLLNNPGAGIRMNPGSAIISEHIVIELD